MPGFYARKSAYHTMPGRRMVRFCEGHVLRTELSVQSRPSCLAGVLPSQHRNFIKINERTATAQRRDNTSGQTEDGNFLFKNIMQMFRGVQQVSTELEVYRALKPSALCSTQPNFLTATRSARTILCVHAEIVPTHLAR